jgi:hypothetical protein
VADPGRHPPFTVPAKDVAILKIDEKPVTHKRLQQGQAPAAGQRTA